MPPKYPDYENGLKLNEQQEKQLLEAPIGKFLWKDANGAIQVKLPEEYRRPMNRLLQTCARKFVNTDFTIDLKKMGDLGSELKACLQTKNGSVEKSFAKVLGLEKDKEIVDLLRVMRGKDDPKESALMQFADCFDQQYLRNEVYRYNDKENAAKLLSKDADFHRTVRRFVDMAVMDPDKEMQFLLPSRNPVFAKKIMLNFVERVDPRLSEQVFAGENPCFAAHVTLTENGRDKDVMVMLGTGEPQPEKTLDTHRNELAVGLFGSEAEMISYHKEKVAWKVTASRATLYVIPKERDIHKTDNTPSLREMDPEFAKLLPKEWNADRVSGVTLGSLQKNLDSLKAKEPKRAFLFFRPFLSLYHLIKGDYKSYSDKMEDFTKHDKPKIDKLEARIQSLKSVPTAAQQETLCPKPEPKPEKKIMTFEERELKDSRTFVRNFTEAIRNEIAEKAVGDCKEELSQAFFAKKVEKYLNGKEPDAVVVKKIAGNGFADMYKSYWMKSRGGEAVYDFLDKYEYDKALGLEGNLKVISNTAGPDLDALDFDFVYNFKIEEKKKTAAETKSAAAEKNGIQNGKTEPDVTAAMT